MAALKSLVSRMTSQAAALLLVFVLVIALAVHPQLGNSQSQQCTTQLSNLNVCSPFVVPGSPNISPNADCCNALQSIQHDCICSTLRIAAQLPSRCNVPPLNCGNWYGPVFRTSLVGHPVVVSTNPELNRFVSQHEGNLSKAWYTDSFDGIIGPENLYSVHGSSHKYLGNLISRIFGIESPTQSIIYEVEELTCKQQLSVWSSQTSVDEKEAFSEVGLTFL